VGRDGYFRSLPHDLSVETDELTAHLEVKHRVMAERCRREIEEMAACRWWAGAFPGVAALEAPCYTSRPLGLH
jgi:hypothetical protein